MTSTKTLWTAINDKSAIRPADKAAAIFSICVCFLRNFASWRTGNAGLFFRFRNHPYLRPRFPALTLLASCCHLTTLLTYTYAQLTFKLPCWINFCMVSTLVPLWVLCIEGRLLRLAGLYLGSRAKLEISRENQQLSHRGRRLQRIRNTMNSTRIFRGCGLRRFATATSKGPLSGIRVLELGQVGCMSFCVERARSSLDHLVLVYWGLLLQNSKIFDVSSYFGAGICNLP